MSDFQAVNTWTPGRVCEAIERGQVLPHDWREILERSGYVVPPVQEKLPNDPIEGDTQ